AASTPATSPARTCSWTAAPTPERSSERRPAPSRGRHVGAAVPALLERPVDALLAGAADPVPVHRMTQLVEQRARALELAVVRDPDLRQRLVGRQFAGNAARVHALHGCGDPGVREQVRPQGRNGQIRGARESFHPLWHDSATTPETARTR